MLTAFDECNREGPAIRAERKQNHETVLEAPAKQRSLKEYLITCARFSSDGISQFYEDIICWREFARSRNGNGR
jgi:hypothetical protein